MRHSFFRSIIKGTILVLLFCLFLTACSSGSGDSNTVTLDTIEAPKNKDLPSIGLWRISEIVPTDAQNGGKLAFKEGDAFCLTPQLVAIKDYITNKPTFSAKFVRLDDYLTSRLINQSAKDLKAEEATILMIRDSDVFSLDLVELSDGRVFFIYDSTLYFLTKESNQVPQKMVENYLKFSAVKEVKQPGLATKNLRMSLVGLRETVETDDGEPVDSYSTYMIFDDPKSEKPIISKTTGLFTVDSENQAYILAYEPSRINPQTNLRQGKFIYYSASDPDRKKAEVLMDQNARQVTYMGNNMVSFSRKNPAAKKEAPRRYELRRLDDLVVPLSLSVKDIAPLSEVQAFKEQIQTQKSFTDPQGLIKDNDEETDLYNIGVIRETVNWSFVTSKFWKVGERYVSALIPINLTTDLPIFETSKNPVSWSKVTTRFTGVQTASSPPDQDLILVKTEDELHYFHISQGSLDPKSAVSIQLKSDSSVVSIAHYSGDTAYLIRDQFLHQRLSQPQIIYNN